MSNSLVSVIFLIKCNGVWKECVLVCVRTLVHVCVLSLAPALCVARQVNE